LEPNSVETYKKLIAFDEVMNEKLAPQFKFWDNYNENTFGKVKVTALL
jgi:hypothetical protein